jgi:hypothetical protein
LFIHSSINAHGIVSNMGFLWRMLLRPSVYRFLCGHVVVLLDICPRMKLLVHLVTVTFWGTAKFVFQSGCTSFIFQPAKYKISDFSTSSPNLLSDFCL